MKEKAYQYTPEQKTKWNKRYSDKRKKMGWKFLGFCVPVHIATELHALKCRRMAEYQRAMAGKLEGE